MKKNILYVIVIAFVATIGLLYVGCEKHNPQFELEKNRPQVETLSATSISSQSATIRGNIIYAGRYKLLKQGFFYGTDSGFANSNFVSCAVGNNEYETTLANLQPSTTYYYKAYAENRIGFTYGDVVSFTTAQAPNNPDDNSGNNGNGDENENNNGNGEGNDNNNGEGNGNDPEETITIPIVQTNPATNVNGNTATLNGNIMNNGGMEITDKGFKYGISPSNLSTTVSSGNGPDAFAAELTGLNTNTIYYYCAYATNSAGIGTGEVKVFATNSICDCGTVTDYDGNVYQTVQLGEQCWMRENLRAEHYKDGEVIANLKAPYNRADSVPKYGYFYKDASVTTQSQLNKVCPSGWHIPTNSEVNILIYYLKDNYVCGSNTDNIAKSIAAKEGWEKCYEFCAPGYDLSTNNASGFNALPVGEATYGDGELRWGNVSHFLTYDISTNYTSRATFSINYNHTTINNTQGNRVSIRCVKD